MNSLDYYAIEELLTDEERAAVVQLTGAGLFDIPDASTRCE